MRKVDFLFPTHKICILIMALLRWGSLIWFSGTRIKVPEMKGCDVIIKKS